MMDLDIVIKGGIDLKKIDPARYEAFEEKLGELVLDTFPEVGGCFQSPEPGCLRSKDAKTPEQIRRDEIIRALSEVLKEPEFQGMLRKAIEA